MLVPIENHAAGIVESNISYCITQSGQESSTRDSVSPNAIKMTNEQCVQQHKLNDVPNPQLYLYGIDYTKVIDVLFQQYTNEDNDNDDCDDHDDYSVDDGSEEDNKKNNDHCFNEKNSNEEQKTYCPDESCRYNITTSQTQQPQSSSSTPSCPVFTLPSKQQKSARGSLTRYEYYVQKKIPQITYMIRRVLSMIHDNNKNKHQLYNDTTPYTILDVGGGRGDLSILLAYTLLVLRLRDTPPLNASKGLVPTTSMTGTSEELYDTFTFHVTVIDRNKRSLQIGEQYAKYIFHTLLSLDYKRYLSFQCCDFISDYVLRHGCKGVNSTDESPSLILFNPSPTFDLIIALHACGDLTDAALYYATNTCTSQDPKKRTNRRPSFILCPCCYNKSCSHNPHQNDNQHQFVPPYFQFQYLVHPTPYNPISRSRPSSVPVPQDKVQCSDLGKIIDASNTTLKTPKYMNRYPDWIVSIQRLAELSQQFTICRRAAIVINSLRILYASASTSLCPLLNDGTSLTSNVTAATLSFNEATTPMDRNGTGHSIRPNIHLEEFSSSFSRRNIVIVGSF
jgi:hypothetical protein